jgi:calcineurin-like phosphoesterase
MCGETGGILGMDAESVIKRMRSHLPLKFEVAKGAPRADGVIFTINESTKKVVGIERISF